MCAHKQQNREGMLNIFQDFRNWLKHHILFPLACYPFAAYLKFFLPFIDFDGSKFPWLCSFHISSKGPFSFWISPASYLLQTATRHVKDIFGTPTREPLFLTGAFQNLPQSSTFLQILYHWPHRKGKKSPQEIGHCLSGWTRKTMFPSVDLSLCMRLFSLALQFTCKLWETGTVILICIFQCLAQQLPTRPPGITVIQTAVTK